MELTSTTGNSGSSRGSEQGSEPLDQDEWVPEMEPGVEEDEGPSSGAEDEPPKLPWAKPKPQMPDAEADGQTGAQTEDLMAMVRQFFESRGSVLQVPRFNRAPLDLPLMWGRVQELGGYDEVTKEKLWASVARTFNPPKSMTNMSFIVKKLYERTLLAYERHLAGVEVPLPPANLPIRGSSSKKAREGKAATKPPGAKPDASSPSKKPRHSRAKRPAEAASAGGEATAVEDPGGAVDVAAVDGGEEEGKAAAAAAAGGDVAASDSVADTGSARGGQEGEAGRGEKQPKGKRRRVTRKAVEEQPAEGQRDQAASEVQQVAGEEAGAAAGAPREDQGQAEGEEGAGEEAEEEVAAVAKRDCGRQRAEQEDGEGQEEVKQEEGQGEGQGEGQLAGAGGSPAGSAAAEAAPVAAAGGVDEEMPLADDAKSAQGEGTMCGGDKPAGVEAAALAGVGGSTPQPDGGAAPSNAAAEEAAVAMLLSPAPGDAAAPGHKAGSGAGSRAGSRAGGRGRQAGAANGRLRAEMPFRLLSPLPSRDPSPLPKETALAALQYAQQFGEGRPQTPVHEKAVSAAAVAATASAAAAAAAHREQQHTRPPRPTRTKRPPSQLDDYVHPPIALGREPSAQDDSEDLLAALALAGLASADPGSKESTPEEGRPVPLHTTSQDRQMLPPPGTFPAYSETTSRGGGQNLGVRVASAAGTAPVGGQRGQAAGQEAGGSVWDAGNLQAMAGMLWGGAGTAGPAGGADVAALLSQAAAAAGQQAGRAGLPPLLPSVHKVAHQLRHELSPPPQQQQQVAVGEAAGAGEAAGVALKTVLMAQAAEVIRGLHEELERNKAQMSKLIADLASSQAREAATREECQRAQAGERQARAQLQAEVGRRLAAERAAEQARGQARAQQQQQQQQQQGHPVSPRAASSLRPPLLPMPGYRPPVPRPAARPPAASSALPLPTYITAQQAQQGVRPPSLPRPRPHQGSVSPLTFWHLLQQQQQVQQQQQAQQQQQQQQHAPQQQGQQHAGQQTPPKPLPAPSMSVQHAQAHHFAAPPKLQAQQQQEKQHQHQQQQNQQQQQQAQQHQQHAFQHMLQQLQRHQQERQQQQGRHQQERQQLQGLEQQSHKQGQGQGQQQQEQQQQQPGQERQERQSQQEPGGTQERQSHQEPGGAQEGAQLHPDLAAALASLSRSAQLAAEPAAGLATVSTAGGGGSQQGNSTAGDRPTEGRSPSPSLA